MALESSRPLIITTCLMSTMTPQVRAFALILLIALRTVLLLRPPSLYLRFHRCHTTAYRRERDTQPVPQARAEESPRQTQQQRRCQAPLPAYRRSRSCSLRSHPSRPVQRLRQVERRLLQRCSLHFCSVFLTLLQPSLSKDRKTNSFCSLTRRMSI